MVYGERVLDEKKKKRMDVIGYDCLIREKEKRKSLKEVFVSRGM